MLINWSIKDVKCGQVLSTDISASFLRKIWQFISWMCSWRNAFCPLTFQIRLDTWCTTSLKFNNSTRTVHSNHTVFMCFIFIWEQTATCVTYSINWLVFITEMKSVYSAVRTGSLNKAVCASSLKGWRNSRSSPYRAVNTPRSYKPTSQCCVMKESLFVLRSVHNTQTGHLWGKKEFVRSDALYSCVFVNVILSRLIS